MAARDPFTNPYVQPDPIRQAVEKRKKAQRWDRLVLRRQRILKANGFNVVVDGNWGKRTSSAWWRYNRGLGPVAGTKATPANPVGTPGEGRSKSVIQPKPPPLVPKFAAQPPVSKIAQQALARARRKAALTRVTDRKALATMSARAIANAPRRPLSEIKGPPTSVLQGGPTSGEWAVETKRRDAVSMATMMAEAQHDFKVANNKKDDPKSWTARDIRALFASPITAIRDWQNKPEYVKRIQVWLTAHGHYVGITGIWNAETSDALVAEMYRRDQNYKRWRARQIVKRVYRPLGLKPGEKGFPVLGTTPTEAELIKIAEEGGFTAQMVFKALGDQLFDVNKVAAFRKWQNDELNQWLRGGKSIAAARSAFGPFLSQWQLDGMSTSEKYAMILLGFSSHSDQQEARGIEGFSVREDPSERGDTVFKQIRAIANSSSEKDLRNKLRWIQQKDEKDYQFWVSFKEATSDDFTSRAGGWLQRALSEPTEEVQDALITAEAFFATVAKTSGWRPDEGSQAAFERYQRERQLHLDLWAQFEQDHPWYSFGIDVATDPWNLMPASWIGHGWRGTKAGVKAIESAGDLLISATAQAPLPMRYIGKAGGVGLKIAPAYLQGLQQGARSTRYAIKESKIGKLGRTVKEQVDEVTTVVSTAAHHMFQPSSKNDPADLAALKDNVRDQILDSVAKNPFGQQQKFNIIEQIDGQIAGAVDSATALANDLISTSAKNRLSLFTHQAGGNMSDWGRSTRATYLSMARVMHIENEAVKAMEKTYEDVLKRETSKLKRRGEPDLSVFAHLPDDARKLSEDRILTAYDKATKHVENTAREAAKKAYNQFKYDAATYEFGATLEMQKLITPLVNESGRIWDTAIAPAIQRQIEKSLDDWEQHLIDSGKRKRGYTKRTLWASDGNYVTSNRSTTIETLRQMLRDTFDDLDEEIVPKATIEARINKVKKQMLKEHEAEFAERLAALDEQIEDLIAGETTLRKAILGDRVVLIKDKDGNVITRVPLEEREFVTPHPRGKLKDLTDPEGKKKIASQDRKVTRMETPQEAGERWMNENKKSLDSHTWEEGVNVNPHPVMINKQDGAILFGPDATTMLARGRAGEVDLSGWNLTEARVGWKGDVDSLSEKVIDLESGELVYAPEAFADEGFEGTAEFKIARDKLAYLDKQIKAFRSRKAGANRAHTAEARESGWTARDEGRLRGLQKSKRELLAENPALETWQFRGRNKKKISGVVKNLINREVGPSVKHMRDNLMQEKSAARKLIDEDIADAREAAEHVGKQSRVWIPNADAGRVYSRQEYEFYIATHYDARVKSLGHWKATRKAVGDTPEDELNAIVEAKLAQHQDELEKRFAPTQDGQFQMTIKGKHVPAIYARNQLGSYRGALKGRHAVFEDADTPEWVKGALSIAATPAEAKNFGALAGIERLAAAATGVAPYPVHPVFGGLDDAGKAVAGRKMSIVRDDPTKRGIPDDLGQRRIRNKETGESELREFRSRQKASVEPITGTLQALGTGTWKYVEFDPEMLVHAKNFKNLTSLIKVASQHSYPKISKQHYAYARALKETQSETWRLIHDILAFGRELFVFSVLPARPAALFRNVFDSFLKIIVSGLQDVRHWHAPGMTNGEIKARQMARAVSADARASMVASKRTIGGADRNAARGKISRKVSEKFLAEEREFRTALGLFQDAHQGLKDAKERAWDKAFEIGNDADEAVSNFFQFGINQMDQMIRLMVGPKYADAMSIRFRHIMDTAFWGRQIHVVSDWLRVEGIDIQDHDKIVFGIQEILKDGEATSMKPRSRPSNADWARMEGVREADIEDWIKSVEGTGKLKNMDHPVVTLLSHFKDVAWDLMVGRAEGWIRKGLFQSEYAKILKKTGDKAQAMTGAMKKIDDTLFDYSRQTVLDENLRYLIPFYFFWRRNLKFWATAMVRKPWIPASILMYQEAMDVQNHQDPEWSRRYVRLPFLNDQMSKLPVANWLLGAHPDGFEVGTDPMSWVSAAPLYRAFKNENPTLPADSAGLPFVSGLVEGMSDFGLGLSPWFRKPLELVGVIDYRAWQVMFPQTAMVDVYTERFLNELFPDGLNVEEVLQDSVFQYIGVGLSASKLNKQRVDEAINLEMAAQYARGEGVDREKATQRVKQFFYLQTVFGFSSGAYLRNLDPTQLNFYKIQQDLILGELDYLTDLSPREKLAYQMFIKRKLNPGAHAQYISTIEKQEQFYALEGTWTQRQEFLNRNPEIIPYVTPERNGRPAMGNVDRGMKHIGLVTDTKATIDTLKVFSEINLDDDPGVRDSLQRHFVTDRLKKFWAKNDTKQQMRDSMMKGEVFRYTRDMRTDYFSIPERDKEARQQYLKENPLLAESFLQDNNAADDLRAVLNAVNADLREVYFDYVDKGDWDGARDFLARYPRIFQFTKAEDRVTDDGTWLPSKAGSPRAKAFVAAQAGIQHYYELKKKNKEAAYKWLASNDPAAKLAKAYFAKYADNTGLKSEHARDYVKLKPVLKWFFDTLPEKGEYKGYHSKWEWVFESKDEQAVALRRYFRKYGDKNGMTQHARDYVAIKGQLKPYFALREAGKDDEARAYLDKHPEVSAYFKKYGKTNAAARKWGEWVKSENPEINRRLMFWKRYFELEPDKRPSFVHNKAEEYGVFVWGLDEDKARHDHDQDYLRKAKKRHLTPKSALYLKVKPFLDLMRTLDKDEKKILMRLNPDLREYLEKYSGGPKTGSKALDKKVETYFSLEPDSDDRAAFLRQNPDVQKWFDKKNPADAAIHNLLEVYFGFTDKRLQQEYADLHPEIEDYFDRKREEDDNFRGALQEFDMADPRDEELRKRAQMEIVHAAEIMWARLRMDGARNLAGDELLVRRERDPERVKERRITL